MKKLILILFAVVTLTATAQVKPVATGIATSNMFDNTYVGVLGGVTTPMNMNSVFPLNTTAGIKIGKYITPVVGVNVEGSVQFGSNCGGTYPARYSYRNIVRGLYVGINPTINWTNMFLGYNPNKVFTVSTETGLGWFHAFYGDNYSEDTNDFGTKLGVVLDWALGKEKAWSVYAEPVVYWNLTNGDRSVYFNKNNAQVGIEVGVNYHFKNQYGTRNFVVGKIFDGRAVKHLNDEVNNLRKENGVLREELAKKPKVVTDTIVKKIDNKHVVTFKQGSSELTKEAYEILNKIPSGSVVSIIGTTSPEGSTQLNNVLSVKRADAVASYLKSRNVKVTSAKGKSAGRLGIVTIE